MDRGAAGNESGAARIEGPATRTRKREPRTLDKALSQLGEPGLLLLFALFLRRTQFVGNPAVETLWTEQAVDVLRLKP